MASLKATSSLSRLTRSPPSSISGLCVYLELLQLPSRRTFHTFQCRKAIEKKGQDAATAAISGKDPLKGKPDHLKLTAAQRAALAAKRARENLKKQEDKASRYLKTGSLASNSIFGDEMLEPNGQTKSDEANATLQEGLANRNFANMERILNPRPNAKARWQRRMLIRHVRRGGRLTKEMVIARTERNHLSKSHFFKTSMKKLAPLTRQIAGKSVDQAILQMRFSKKKAAQDVLGHLIQARNEAIAIKGMGLDSSQPPPAPGPVVLDPSITPAGPNQKANKKNKDGSKSETEIYIDQAWINRGPYGQEPDYRARGRVFMLRPPHTGLSVLLKEEKTKLRIQEEKEAKAIRKRMGKNMWTQLPDRPIINQIQYVLW